MASTRYDANLYGSISSVVSDWLSDSSRKEGDHGIVKTDYGYHIMYYVGSDLVWFLTAETDMMAQKGNDFLAQILEKNPTEIDYAAIELGSVNMGAEG